MAVIGDELPINDADTVEVTTSASIPIANDHFKPLPIQADRSVWTLWPFPGTSANPLRTTPAAADVPVYSPYNGLSM